MALECMIGVATWRLSVTFLWLFNYKHAQKLVTNTNFASNEVVRACEPFDDQDERDEQNGIEEGLQPRRS